MADLHNLECMYYVINGLKAINNKDSYNKFFNFIIEKRAYNLGETATITGIAFYVVPLINAICRAGEYEDKINVFKAMCNIEEVCIDKVRGHGEVEMSLQEFAFRKCEKAKRKQDKNSKEATELLEKQMSDTKANRMGIIFCKSDDTLDSGLNGLVANKIASKYHKPCLVGKEFYEGDKTYIRGSGRGYSNHEIRDFRQWCLNTGLFSNNEGYVEEATSNENLKGSYAEGHSNAFGFSLLKEDAGKLFEYLMRTPISDEIVYHVDGVFDSNTLNKAMVLTVGQFSHIWSTHVQEPLMAIEISSIATSLISIRGKNNRTFGFNYNGIDFYMFNINQDYYARMVDNQFVKMTIIGKFKCEEYKGFKRPKVEIIDYKFEPINRSLNPFEMM